MGFTISDETGQVTLLDFCTLWCFMVPPALGITEGKEAGVVGILIGVGIGLGAGGLAAYALRRKVEYWDKLEATLKSQPWVVKKLMLKGIQVWGVFLMFGPTFMMLHLMKFIGQRMAG